MIYINKNINLVLQGGGIKGLAYIGALRYLEENYYQINYVSGSSVGAIIATLISAGYDSYELEDIVNSISYKNFATRNNLKEIIKKQGIHSIKDLENYIEKLLLNKGKRTFKDFKIGNNYKIIIITTSMQFKRIFVLPYDLRLLNIDPDSFPLSKAVAMSASMPLFYEPYILNGYKFYDGGLSDNYPSWCFSKAIALKLTKENKTLSSIKEKVFGSIKNNNEITEILIDTTGFKATDFKKGMDNRYVLYNRGYLSLKNYLEKR